MYLRVIKIFPRETWEDFSNLTFKDVKEASYIISERLKQAHKTDHRIISGVTTTINCR